MTSFLQTGAMALTVADLVTLIGACIFGVVAFLHHLGHDRSPSTFHMTELAKLCALLSIALSLAVILCWSYFVVSYLHDFTQTCQSIFNCTLPKN
jgi:hypothetical protein